MVQTIINTVMTFIISGVLGYTVRRAKDYKERLNDKYEESKLLKNALMTMLQNNLTNTYFVYNEIGEIPDYVLKNWLNSFKIYRKLGGNDYVDTIKEKMDNWQITKTDILDK